MTRRVRDFRKSHQKASFVLREKSRREPGRGVG